MPQKEMMSDSPLPVALEEELGRVGFPTHARKEVSSPLVILLIRLGRVIADEGVFVGASLRRSPVRSEFELYITTIFGSEEAAKRNEMVVAESFGDLVQGRTGKSVVALCTGTLFYSNPQDYTRIFLQEAGRVGGQFHHLQSLKPFQDLPRPAEASRKDGEHHHSTAEDQVSL